MGTLKENRANEENISRYDIESSHIPENKEKLNQNDVRKIGKKHKNEEFCSYQSSKYLHNKLHMHSKIHLFNTFPTV